MKRLSELENNTVCTAAWIVNLPSYVHEFLEKRAVRMGSELCVIQNSSCGLIVSAGGKRLAIDPQTASRIWANAAGQ